MLGLVTLATDLFAAEAPLRFMGLRVGRRMAVVRLSDGGLFLHSPAPLDSALRATLDELGSVRFVAAASLLHGHLFMEQYAAATPTQSCTPRRGWLPSGRTCPSLPILAMSPTRVGRLSSTRCTSPATVT